MGNESSLPSVSPTDERIYMEPGSNRKLNRHIPKNNSIQKISANQNEIQDLPTKLPKLIELNLASNKYKAIPARVLNAIVSYPQLQILNLSMNYLAVLPPQIANKKSLKRLELAKNKLTSLNINSNELEFLDISQNRIKEYPKLPQSIQMLDCSYNLIPSFIVEYPNIIRLHITMNKLQIITINNALPTLKFLNLDKNLLHSLPDLSILAPKLRVFSASNNYLSVFPNLPQTITTINISDNAIEEIPESIFDLSELNTLNISMNMIKNIPRLAPSLNSLICHDNQIETIEPQKLPNLMTFLCMRNRIIDINHIAVGTKDFRYQNNCIKNLEPCSLPADTSTVLFNTNFLEEVPGFFSKFISEPQIFMANNKITKIDPNISKCRVTTFGISINPLKKLEYFPERMIRLMCGYCELDELPESLSTVPNLLILDAPGNRLSKPPIISTLCRLNLSRNNLTEAPPLTDMIELLDLSFNRIKSIKTMKMKNVIEVDLSYNLLTQLPEEFECPKLMVLKVSHNYELEGTIDCTTLPFLEALDVAATKLNVTTITKMRELITSQGTRSLVNKIIPRCDWAGYAETRGPRPTMEDAIIFAPDLGRQRCDLFAVLDGHGGWKTSNAAAFLIARRFEQETDISLENVSAIISAVNNELLQLKVTDGSTMALAVLIGELAIIAHLGDARVIVTGEDGTVAFATQDHKPDSKAEIARINELGGVVREGRTDGILAVARSLGDFSVEGVGHCPSITALPLKPSMEKLIICCDGVFDVCSNEEVAALAPGADAAELAYDIRNRAIQLLSMDNVSTIVVDLEKRRQAKL